MFNRIPRGDVRMPHAISPNRWKGESDCVVGPFSDPRVTEHFATFVVNEGSHEVTAGDVFARGDGWYLTIDRFTIERIVT